MLRRTRATAPLGALAASVALSGCGAAGPAEEGAAAAAVTAETATATADGGAPGGAGTGVKAAPGVLPPTGEPKPGEARLTADGYYDYTADDFELGEPCTPEILERAEKAGFSVTLPEANSDISGHHLICAVAKTGAPPATIFIDDLGRTSELRKNVYREIKTDGNTSWYTIHNTGADFGICKAGIETVNGGRGITIAYDILGQINTAEDACGIASSYLKLIILGG